jgi:hypothetical protein
MPFVEVKQNYICSKKVGNADGLTLLEPLTHKVMTAALIVLWRLLPSNCCCGDFSANSWIRSIQRK